jgi:LysM domain
MADTRRDPVTSPRRRRRSEAAQMARGLLAVVVLLTLCVGIPVALVALTSTSFPSGVPSLPQILGELTRGDDGRLFLAVLTAAGWVGWATFTSAVLVELPAQIRGVPTVRLRGLGVQQSLAGGLVATALTVLVLPSAMAAERSSTGIAVGVHAGTRAAASGLVVPGRRSEHLASVSGPQEAEVRERSTSGRSEAVASAPLGGEEYVVRGGDTLWDIAAQHLGDGTRWRRIAALNYGRAQPDGGRLDRSHVLHAGWRLVLPAAAHQRLAPQKTRVDTGHAVRERLVRSGDTLSAIAREELGDADRYPELVSSSRDIAQPGGRHLTDPDRIYPGWTVDIPIARHAAAVSTESRTLPRTPASAVAHVGPAGAPPRSPAATEPSGSPAASSEPGATLDPARRDASTTSGQSGRSSVSPSPATPVHSDSESAGHLADEVIDVRTGAGVGGLLAACLVLLLGARRSGQQRRRRPGERIRLPSRAALVTEARLRAIADPAGIDHVDLALRSLAAHHRAAGRVLPGLRAARLTTTQLELYLAGSAQLPEPWVATSDPTVWAMRHEDLTCHLETDMRAPFPGLVTIGHDLEGAHVLVDLEQLTALAVEGPRDETLPVLAALAVELATSPWADDMLVTLVGCLPELPSAVTTGRLRHVERLDGLVSELEGRAQDVERVLRDAGVDGMPAARGTGVADDAWSPEIVILADDVPEPLRNRLEEVLYQVPRVGLAAVTATGPALSEWRLLVQPDSDMARLEPTGLTLRPQRLVGAEYAHVLEMLQVADDEAVEGPSWAARLDSHEQTLADLPVPAVDARSDDPNHQTTAADDLTVAVEAAAIVESADAGPPDVVRLPTRPPFVRLLGPVEVVGALGPEPMTLKDGRTVASHVGRATALVAYLACRPEGATTEQLSEALSPVRRLSPSTVWSLASRTRKWLGSDADGVPYFPRTVDAGSNRLHPAVRTDWSVWSELVGDDITKTPLPRLTEALDLVRGRPFERVAERHYTWAEPLRQDMVAGVVDVAHEVVRRALLIPDAATGRRAATLARLVDPTNELVWRDALRVEYVAGNRESRRRLVELVYAMADELETDLEPATEELIDELERSSQSRAASR